MEPVDTYFERRCAEQSCGRLSKHPGIAPLGWAIQYQFRAAVGNSGSICRQGSWIHQAGLPPWRPSDGVGCRHEPTSTGAYFGFSDRAAQPGRMPAVSAPPARSDHSRGRWQGSPDVVRRRSQARNRSVTGSGATGASRAAIKYKKQDLRQAFAGGGVPLELTSITKMSAPCATGSLGTR